MAADDNPIDQGTWLAADDFARRSLVAYYLTGGYVLDNGSAVDYASDYPPVLRKGVGITIPGGGAEGGTLADQLPPGAAELVDLSTVRPEPRPVNWLPGWLGRYSLSTSMHLPNMPNAGWLLVGAGLVLILAGARRGRRGGRR